MLLTVIFSASGQGLHVCAHLHWGLCESEFSNAGSLEQCTKLLRKRFQRKHNANAFRKTEHSLPMLEMLYESTIGRLYWDAYLFAGFHVLSLHQHRFTGHICKNMKDLLNQQAKQALSLWKGTWFQSFSKTIRTPISYWAAIWLWNGKKSLMKQLSEVCLCQHSFKGFFGAFKPSKGKAECIRSLTRHFNQQWDQNRSKSTHVHVDIILHVHGFASIVRLDTL